MFLYNIIMDFLTKILAKFSIWNPAFLTVCVFDLRIVFSLCLFSMYLTKATVVKNYSGVNNFPLQSCSNENFYKENIFHFTFL